MPFILAAIVIALLVFFVWQVVILFVERRRFSRGWVVFFRLVVYIAAPLALALWLASFTVPLLIGAFS